MFPCLRIVVFCLFAFEHLQGSDQPVARIPREDDIVDVAPLGRQEGVGKGAAVVLHPFVQRGLGIFGRLNLPSVDDLGCALGTHDCDFRRGPGIVDITVNVLGIHHQVSASVSLSYDDGDPRDGGIGKSVEKLGAVPDDPAVLLIRAGHEPGHVHQGDQRYVERIAEADENARP